MKYKIIEKVPCYILEWHFYLKSCCIQRTFSTVHFMKSTLNMKWCDHWLHKRIEPMLLVLRDMQLLEIG